eukprot:m51a1_g9620 hypothetical protein (107) ;mRNA; r:1098422-1101430
MHNAQARWKVRYGKAYPSQAEDDARFAAFRANAAKVDANPDLELNKGGKRCEAGMCRAQTCDEERTCRNRCGRVLDECDNYVECGRCATGDYCTRSGYCKWDDYDK